MGNKYSHLSKHLPDIQTTKDKRNVFINKVGISKVRLPITVLEKSGGFQSTIGDVSVTVELPADKKGTHMSRLSIILNEHIDENKTFSSKELLPLARQLLDEMETTKSYVEVELDYFRTVHTPVTNIPGVLPSKATLSVSAEKIRGGVKYAVTTGIVTHGKTCCPCSREISDFDPGTGRGQGAHAQRGEVTIRVENNPKKIIWFEDLIEIAESSVSERIYPLLKRVDERHVTMGAYNNPCFVEDVVRNAAVQLRKMRGIYSLYVKAENAESIHRHDAVGEVWEDIRIKSARRPPNRNGHCM